MIRHHTAHGGRGQTDPDRTPPPAAADFSSNAPATLKYHFFQLLSIAALCCCFVVGHFPRFNVVDGRQDYSSLYLVDFVGRKGTSAHRNVPVFVETEWELAKQSLTRMLGPDLR